MNEDENLKEQIQIPVTVLAKMICDNLFTKETKENLYKRYLPIVVAEGNAIKEQMKKELGDDTGGEEWNPVQDESKLKIRNDSILNTVMSAVHANLDSGFAFAKDIITKEILRKVREELKK